MTATARNLFELVEPPTTLEYPARDAEVTAGFIACINNPHTLKAYRQDLAAFRAACSSGLRVQLAELAGWVNSMEEDGAAGKTIQRRLATVRSLLSYARDTGAIDTVPAWRHLRLPPDTSAAVARVLTVEEVQQLIAHTTGPARLAVRVLYGLGLRVSEACALTWADLRSADSGGWARVLGKGGKYRDVGIAPALWARLQEQRSELLSDTEVLTLTPSQLDKAIRQAARAAGMDKTPSAHWLRHSHITHALQAGCPWHEVAEQAGHSSIAITQRIYAHLTRGKTSAEYLEDV